MKLWLVTVWGSPYDEDLANGPDTNCFVSAETFERAVELGETYLKLVNGDWRLGHSDQVMLLGEIDSKVERAYWHFVAHAFPFDGVKKWDWDSFDEKW